MCVNTGYLFFLSDLLHSVIALCWTLLFTQKGHDWTIQNCHFYGESNLSNFIMVNLIVWWRVLRDPRTVRRSNQSILKEINPEYSLEGLLLKLKLQYLGCLMWKANSLEKILILGKIEGKIRREWQRMRWLDSIIYSVDMHLSTLQEIVEDRGAWHATNHEVEKSWIWLSHWTTGFNNRQCHLPVNNRQATTGFKLRQSDSMANFFTWYFL